VLRRCFANKSIVGEVERHHRCLSRNSGTAAAGFSAWFLEPWMIESSFKIEKTNTEASDGATGDVLFEGKKTVTNLLKNRNRPPVYHNLDATTICKFEPETNLHWIQNWIQLESRYHIPPVDPRFVAQEEKKGDDLRVFVRLRTSLRWSTAR